MRARYTPEKTMRTWLLVGITALITAVFWMKLPPIIEASAWPALILFGALIAGAEAMAIPLPRGEGFVSVGFAICFAAAIVLGPSLGALLVFFATINKHDLFHAPLPILFFNRFELALATGLSGLVYSLLLPPGATSLVSHGAAFVGGAVTYTAVNLGLVLLFLWVRDLKFPHSYWQANMKWALTSYFGLLPLAVLVVFSYFRAGWFGVLLLVLPLLVARHSFLLYIEVRKSYLDTITSLVSAVEAKDPYTAGHSQRVSKLSLAIGRQLKLPEPTLEKLNFAALLHDVGKIGIPDSILNKPGRFTCDEYEQMKRHTEIGAQIIQNVKFLGKAADWVRHHHERWDGSGYPDGLKGEEIPIGARIIAVADSFDAMISKREYRGFISIQDARDEIIRLSGIEYDPEVVRAFNRVLNSPEFMDEIACSLQTFDVPATQSVQR